MKKEFICNNNNFITFKVWLAIIFIELTNNFQANPRINLLANKRMFKFFKVKTVLTLINCLNSNIFQASWGNNGSGGVLHNIFVRVLSKNKHETQSSTAYRFVFETLIWVLLLITGTVSTFKNLIT